MTPLACALIAAIGTRPQTTEALIITLRVSRERVMAGLVLVHEARLVFKRDGLWSVQTAGREALADAINASAEGRPVPPVVEAGTVAA